MAIPSQAKNELCRMDRDASARARQLFPSRKAKWKREQLEAGFKIGRLLRLFAEAQAARRTVRSA